MWGRLYTIRHDDETLNADTWFTVQPCRRFHYFGKQIIITQPSSTFWVYLLGVLTSVLGGYFVLQDHGQISRLMWGVSLLLWGIGALIAGTSYQAFGYQLKCANRKHVAWTSWWEVIYLIFQQVSISFMLIAVAHSCLGDKGQNFAVTAGVALSAMYFVVVAIGAFKPVKLLITFELMVHFCTPVILFFIGLNAWRYWQLSNDLDLALLGVWFGLIVTMWAFNKYQSLGLTEKLWNKGAWFSENDVLHVALIVWVVYIALIVQPLIRDTGTHS